MMINLLPDEVKRDIRFAKYNVIALQYIIISVIAIGAAVGLMFYGRSNLNTTKLGIEKSVQQDRQRVAELEPINEEAQQLSDTVNTIATIIDQEVKFSYVMQEISALIPPGVVLNSITFNQDTSEPMRLTVSMVEPERAGVLEQNLTESRIFVGADVLSISQSNNETYPFSGDLQAYYDKAVQLNTLDDPQETDTQGVTQ